VQNSTLWRTLLGVDKTIVEAVDVDVETGVLVASVRPTASMRN
jgi:transposase